MRHLAALLTGLLALSSLTLSAQDCDGADHTVYAGSFYYEPATLTITAGETVAWFNEAGFHDVNGNVSVLTGESFGNPEVFSLPSVNASGADVCMGTVTFTVPGTYNYDCSIGSHAANGMVGTIVVEEAVVESGCNDDLACNYDEAATSDVDCLYDDGTFDLSQGLWVNAAAALDPDVDCAIQPAEGVLVQVNNTAGSPVTLVVDAGLQDWVDGLVAQGLLTALEATLAVSAFNNAVFSFCGETVSGDAGLISITSTWNGEAWNIAELGFNLAPVTSMMDGCPDPTATNYDPCANPDPATCTYESGCNDMAACNYDETATSDADCIYVDTPYDLSAGALLGIPFAQFELDTTATCPVQPINDLTIQMDLSDGQQATFVVDDGVQAYFDAAVAAGTVSQEEADLFFNLIENATMTFCGDTMVATLPVFGEVVSEWTGSHWMITPIGYYIAPISTVPVGCGDPTAENFDLCVINDPSACEYAEPGCNDPLACNYDENATNAEDCIYLEAGNIILTQDGVQTTDLGAGEDPVNAQLEYVGEGIVTWSITAPLELDTTNGNPVSIVEASLLSGGPYEVCATVTLEGCTEEVCITFSVNPVSVFEVLTAPWSLFPNPTDGALRIDWTGEATLFEVFDLNGRRVHASSVYPGVTTLDLSGLQPGLYLAGPQGAEPQRLAIQR